MATIVGVIDAIASDLEAQNLVAHQVWKYVEPRSLRIDQGNWLQVYVTTTQETILTTTPEFDNYETLIVKWSVPALDGTELNQGDDTAAAAGLATAETIKARLKTYAAGVPTIANCWAVLQTVTYDLKDSQWDMTATIRVEWV